MVYFPSLKGKSLDELEQCLYEAAKRGDVRLMLDEEIVPMAHIGESRLPARRSVQIISQETVSGQHR
jgi:hypothetical protein